MNNQKSIYDNVSPKTRWDFVINEVEFALYALLFDEYTEITQDEVEQVISVLKNNVPFGEESVSSGK